MIEQPIHRSVGPLLLSPRTSPRHVWSYCVAALMNAVVVSFFPLMQPFILGEIGLPKDLLGRTAGSLAFAQSMAVLFCTIFFGALTDRIGPNRMVTGASVGMTCCALLYPLMPDLASLFLIAVFLGVAQTGQLVGGNAINMDYPDNSSRGRYLSFLTIFQIIGVMLLLGQFASRVPTFLKGFGFGPQESIRYGFWVVAALSGLGVIFAFFGLKRQDLRPNESRRRLSGELRKLASGIAAVIRHAKHHKPFRLVLVAGLTVRADFAVITTFLSLWVANSAKTQGIAQAVAVAHVGQLYTVVLIGNLAMTILTGFIIDKVDRRRLLVGTVALVAISLVTPSVLPNVFGPTAYLVAIFLGIAEGAVLVPVMSTLGQETPPAIRGATSGVFTLIGIIGVSAMNFMGGIVFDSGGATAPFLLVAGVNGVIFLMALRLLLSGKTPRSDSTTEKSAA